MENPKNWREAMENGKGRNILWKLQKPENEIENIQKARKIFHKKFKSKQQVWVLGQQPDLLWSWLTWQHLPIYFKGK